MSYMCIVQRLRFSGFILYPLSFFLYSPFKETVDVILTDLLLKKGQKAGFNITPFYPLSDQ